jgi:hypothetical protein
VNSILMAATDTECDRERDRERAIDDLTCSGSAWRKMIGVLISSTGGGSDRCRRIAAGALFVLTNGDGRVGVAGIRAGIGGGSMSPGDSVDLVFSTRLAGDRDGPASGEGG